MSQVIAAGAVAVPLATRRGTVHRFDDPRGIGVVRGPDGVELPFHCTAIADGTRTIAEGTEVTFRVVPGRRGRWEATDLRPGRPSA
jgi:cold shock CspA family protein